MDLMPIAIKPPSNTDWAEMRPCYPRDFKPTTNKQNAKPKHIMIFEFTGATDWLSDVGAGITQITKIEPVTYNGRELAKIEFATARGTGSGLYRAEYPITVQICRACGFPARAGDRLDSQLLIGRKFWGIWGARIGTRDGYTYADLAAAHPIPADAVEWKPLSAEEWRAMGRDTDGIKFADKQKTAENKAVTNKKEDDDFPF